MEYIEFSINGVGYAARKDGLDPTVSFINDHNEEGESFRTLVEAQQHAMGWESGRKQRYAESGAAYDVAMGEYMDTKINDKKEMENES